MKKILAALLFMAAQAHAGCIVSRELLYKDVGAEGWKVWREQSNVTLEDDIKGFVNLFDNLALPIYADFLMGRPDCRAADVKQSIGVYEAKRLDGNWTKLWSRVDTMKYDRWYLFNHRLGNVEYRLFVRYQQIAD